MTSCEEDDDFALLGDGDGDGDGDDGNDSEAAKAKRRKPGPRSRSQSQCHHNSQKKKDSPYSSTLLVPAPVPVPVPPKKQHQPTQGGSGTGSGTVSSSGDVYRKDREEWSDGAIEALLDAYTHRFELLNRGNLRGRDWEDVAAAVNTTTTTSNKTVEQCKNKIDNLKKRFKVECHRLSSSSTPTSHWPWFSKLHLIVSSSSSNNNNNNNNNNSSSAAFSASRGGSPIPVSIPIPITNTDDDGSPSASASGTPAPARNNKRYAVAAPAMHVFNVPRCKWKRVLLKVSGAALAGTGTDTATAPHNVDPKVVMLIAREIQVVSRQGIQVAVVVGGRNIFCGESWIASTAVDRAATYQICMMASVMNAMVLQASLEKIGVATRVQTNLTMQEVAEPYIRRKAISHLDKGRVVIFGGIASGLGNPLFTTDAAAALRASEINADAVLKGTTVDALYSGCHPGSGNNSSPGFEHISYREFVSRDYTPMDTTAVAFCEENNIPVVLFNLLETGNISRAIAGDQIGTIIDQSGQIG